MGKKGKKSKKKIVAFLLVITVAAGGAGTVVYRKVKWPEKVSDAAEKIQSSEVKKGTISNTIVGTGNLEYADGEEITIPSGLTVSQVLVESGDAVTEGTVLAILDKSSVSEAVQEVQEELSAIDEKISDCQEDDDENIVSSSVAGRVKVIYTEAGDDITDVMVENGALLELSVDGLMAVDIPCSSEIEENETVNVILSDGTLMSGTVEKMLDGEATVTLSDNGSVNGDEVTVTDSEGNVLGSGNLYIHKSFSVTGTAGTVSSVSVSENQKVSAGDTLLVLDGNAKDGEYEDLLEKKESETEVLKNLLKLSKDPEIVATTDGIIQDVNIASSDSTDENSSSASSGGVSKMSYTAGEVKFLNLSFDDGDVEPVADSEETADDAQDNPEETEADMQIQLTVAGSGSSSVSTVVIPSPATGNTPVSGIETTDGSYTGTVTWNPGDSAFAGGVSYQALVVLSAAQGYQFTAESIQGLESGTLSGIHVSEDGKTLEFQIAFPATAVPETENKQQDQKSESNDSQKQEQSEVNVSDSTNTGQSSTDNEQNSSSSQESTGTSAGNAASGGNNSQTGRVSGAAAAATGTDTSKDTETEDEIDSTSQYSSSVTAFTLASDKQVCLSVNVDELDINSVETGQAATITFDAIENKEFQGEVTKVGNTASVNGGVAKYTVELTLDKEDGMKQGMNASATITIEERKDVLTLSMNAIQERGDKSFVYTEKDSDGNLSGEKEVTTGLSDGSTVEITEGLDEGDTVYYMQSGNTKDSSNTGNMPENMDGNMNMPDMNGGPGGDSFGGPGGNMGNSGGGPGM